MRILHVTDCYAGGVSRAIDDIAKQTLPHEHFLLRSGRDQPSDVYVSHESLPKHMLHKIRFITEYADLIHADLIFAHSSFAGFYSRLTRKKVPVVYQPHCFAFHDTTRSRISRNLFWGIEKMLAHRTKAFFTLNNQEFEAVTRFSSKSWIRPCYNKPHVSLDLATARKEVVRTANPVVVMIGRLTAQKNPLYFAKVASLVKEHRTNVDFIWLGDGDESFRVSLNEHAVQVTGWLNEEELTERILGASIYLHSADYEGFPISVLDAAVLGLPIIVRDIPCFQGKGLHTIKSPLEASDSILRLLDDEDALKEMSKQSAALLEQMPPSTFGAIYTKTFEEIANGKETPWRY